MKQQIMRPFLVGAALLAAVIINLFLLQGYPIASLYTIPILIAAYSLRLRSVILVAVLSVSLYLLVGYFRDPSLTDWLLRSFSLSMAAVAIVYLAKLLSSERREVRRNLSEQTELTNELSAANESLTGVQKALQASETRYRIVADNTYDWEIWLDPQGQVLYVSPSCQRITGYSVREFESDPDLILRIIHPEDRSRYENFHADKERQPAAHELDFRIVHRDGSERWIGHLCQPVYDDAGQFLGRRGNNRDITPRIRIETQLRESEAKYRGLYGAIEAGIVVIGTDAAIVDANTTARGILGLSLEQMQGTTTADPSWQAIRENGMPFPGEELPIIMALRTGRKVHNVTLGVVRPDQERRWIMINAAPILSGESEAILGAVATFIDVTERKNAERLREEYTTLISHDLRQPLAMLTGLSDWLRLSLEKTGMEREAKSAATMLNHARIMNAMIQELVDSARLESGQMEVHPMPLSLSDFLTGIVHSELPVEDQGRIQLESLEWVPAVMADPQRIERVAINLLTNALKYSDQNTPVSIHLKQMEGEVIVSVTDKGIGIEPEDLPHLFDRLYRTKRGRQKAEGLGLGLYISRLIMEAHGGRIWVESESGRGSTFSFSLPVAGP